MRIHTACLLILTLAASVLPSGNNCFASSPDSKSNQVVQGAKNNGNSPVAAEDDLDEYKDTAKIADPLQPVNRGIFWVNDRIYHWILKPISKTYDTVLPKPVRTGIFNVFDNVEFPIRFVNNLLQGNFHRSGQEAQKFGINTTVGLAGILRVSDRFPSLVDVPRADTGQTFAKWGIGHGCYIVLPLFGPKSLRDTVGLAGDYALDPVSWLFLINPHAAWTLAITTPDSARSLHDRLNTYDSITQNSLDPYLAARSAYVQNRKKVSSQ
jgi:phospholipid-binding lipoprotein MlaA